MLHQLNNFAAPPLAYLTWDPPIAWWILLPGMIAVGVMLYYLYRAQQQIAPKRIVHWLTAIRIALIALLAILLLRPLWVFKNTEPVGETLWVLLDQSLSMGQRDTQANAIERLRWADALGKLPGELRTSRLDRSAVRLSALHDELLHLQRQTSPAADEKEAPRQLEGFVQSLKDWDEHLNDAVSRLEKDPKAQSGDGPSIAKGLREAADQMSQGIGQAAARTKIDEAASDIPWGKVGAAIDSALVKLNPLAEQADAEFISLHAADQQVQDALAQVAQMRRADIAYAALTGKARDLPKSLTDVFDRQNTKVITFAGGQQIVATAKKDEVAKAMQAGIEPVGTATDIADALKFVSEQVSQGERASVLLVSDGRINDGGDPTDAAQRLAARGVRVFTLGVGSRQVAADASVESIDAPDWIFKDDTLRASALLRLDGLSGRPVKVQFLRGTTVLDTQTVTPTSSQTTTVLTFKDKPPEPDVYEYQVRIQEMPGEAVKENNVQNFRVSVKKDKLQILVVEDQPRWEYRYLANYLKRDNRVHLQTVLTEPAHVADVQAPAPIKASPTNPDYEAQRLPDSAEEWAAFDLIVLGDVPVELLGVEAQKNIAKAVRDRGTSLLVIAGQLNMPARYTGTPLAELLPVHVSSNWTAASLSDHMRNGFRATIAPEGLSSVLSQLDLSDQTNAHYWASMGTGDAKWYWHSEQTQAKQSASVLWQIADIRDGAPLTQQPETDTLAVARQRALLATMPAGVGRVMYLASDQMWRLRQVEGENLTDRFWGQVIRWVVQSDLPAGGRFVRFGTSKPRYTAGDAVVVTARLLKEDFTPLTGQKFKMIARSVTQKNAATGQVQGGAVVATADAAEVPEAPGYYRATLSGVKAGAVEITLQGQGVEKALNDDPSAGQKSLLVDVLTGADRELRNINADRNTLSRIAQAGSGIATDAAYADVLAQHIPNLEHPLETVQQFGLFADPENPFTRKAHWYFLIAFVGLLTAEWILRKVGGLV
ncbi:MAG: hypothetical protein JWN24_3199 [Phycisphaerales bacterium]|nr:hypothetical protein [Phycisphaerales bacterium]